LGPLGPPRHLLARAADREPQVERPPQARVMTAYLTVMAPVRRPLPPNVAAEMGVRPPASIAANRR